ncbi:threonine-phosphate decarboxylase CobD [Mesorhizobium sp. KR9-304]|uniref:threonine-phosphate decarboxylase CobD n=1 Tax=Mesorhizobium sp. KR9-304 TaxID=3156614 RepID=UPI0032B5DE20
MDVPAKAIAAVADHGGSLGRARSLFPHVPQPWIDLSTGINPHSYPLFDLPATALTRLPEVSSAGRLQAAATVAYGAPSPLQVALAPGTQILLPRVFSLVKPGRAVILGPTYAEHRRTASLCGHAAVEVREFSALADADLAVVVNPNNPDGRVVSRADLLALAETLRRRGGLLVVDEAFMDVGPREDSLCGDVGEGGIVVLRSFGKFFGLAGVRLGFAVAAPAIAERLDAEFGPWSVSGPALEYGIRALADLTWQDAMRKRLTSDAARLDAVLAAHGVIVDGGTSLFRHVTAADAAGLSDALGHSGILVRNFADRPDELRFGLPGNEAEWQRLRATLAAWGEGTAVGGGAVRAAPKAVGGSR